MKQIKLQLETLTCPTCIKKIEGALNQTDGVENAKVLFNSSKVKVGFDESKLSTEEISHKIEQLGYQVLKTA
ncbi:cation transporter [Staphylococcus simulans]|uniref:heavy-metal-associated domain-containing protein n=1 Tax=Staphylococcus simulans TaxID=1286 RepID=UPI000D023B67|nr:cation transporter [Staphylococcus simulans]MCD8915841.1 cation transporter [Staphylococcus simulans]